METTAGPSGPNAPRNCSTEPLVSVIVPVYNVENCLARCLDSIVEQTLGNIEIVCVDDGSPDRSIDILRRYAALDGRVRVLRQENRGLGGARNTGLREARGRYVTFVDSDDRLGQPTYLESLYRAAAESHAPVATAGIVKRRGRKARTIARYDRLRVIDTPQERLRACHCPPDFYVWNKLYLRSRVEELGMRFPEGVIFEDVPFTLRALCEAGPLVTVPGVHYDYLVRAHSLTKSRNSLRKQRDRYGALSKAVAYCGAQGVALPAKYRSVPVRSWGIGAVTLLKVRERDGRRRWLLFDFIPLFSCRRK